MKSEIAQSILAAIVIDASASSSLSFPSQGPSCQLHKRYTFEQAASSVILLLRARGLKFVDSFKVGDTKLT
jgi:hypothetical protein